MGKKIKKKPRSAHKEKRVTSSSLRNVSEHSNPKGEIEKEQVSAVKERKSCNHIDKSIDLVNISSKIGSASAVKCEDCRDGPAGGRRVGKGRGKQSRKKEMGLADLKSDPKCIWICLECGHFSCGGTIGDSMPQNHAVLHFKRARHPCVVKFDNPLCSWCFSCNSIISTGTKENTERNDILSEVQELVKGISFKSGVMDVEDIWFSENVEGGRKIENGESSVSNVRGYSIGGLVNLGNTCFFNSVLQNLLALDLLRAYFMNLELSVGPLTMALKKLYGETSVELDSKNCINPKALFGAICSKAPQFRGYQQHDSHEFLRYLLDGLHTEELSARKAHGSSSEDEVASVSCSGHTVVDVMFGGQLSSTVCCVECGHSSIVYEAFLDLSLPLPTKKPLSRKAHVTCAKKAKLPLKEGNKGGRFRERRNANVASVSTQSTTEVRLQSECIESSCVTVPDKLETEQTIALASLQSEHSESSSVTVPNKLETEQAVFSEANYSWMDYIEPAELLDSASSISQNYDSSAIEETGSIQVFQNEGAVRGTSEFLSDACSLNREKQFEDEFPLHVQDSEVLLLPYKEEVAPTKEIVEVPGDPQNPVILAFNDTSLNDANASSSSINGWEETELEFDGLGDLFNEPETSADIKTELGLGGLNLEANDEMETALLAGNSSESNQDEVDNTDAQLSIDSCLAFFTKPELLSDEHAWHCENCSKILRFQMVKARDGKNQAVTTDKQSNSLKCQANGGQQMAFENGKLASGLASANALGSSKPHTERLDTAQKLLNSNDNCASCEFGHENERDGGFLNPVCNGLAQYPEVPQTGEDLGESNCSQDVSCISVCDKTSILVNSGDLYGENVQPSTKDDGNELAVNESEEIDLESTKVKRDATKRILISKAPSILTVHLKRFSQDARGRLNKLGGHVSFRDTLDLWPYMDPKGGGVREKCRYHLVGVVEHSGTMRGGHYVAYVKGQRSRGKAEKEEGNSMWFYTSDAYVREVSLTDVLQSEAYILFYEKV